MVKLTLQEIAVQKSLKLSEQDALKVLIFIAGLDAGTKIIPEKNKNMNMKNI